MYYCSTSDRELKAYPGPDANLLRQIILELLNIEIGA